MKMEKKNVDHILSFVGRVPCRCCDYIIKDNKWNRFWIKFLLKINTRDEVIEALLKRWPHHKY